MEIAKQSEFLLNTTKLLLELRKSIPKQPGSEFSVFSILRDESDEVNLHSRFLYELLNPHGSHGMGDAFLRSFFEVVLHRPYSGEIRVHREFPIPGESASDGGRIDLLLEGNDCCYPIEVKIYAEDQYRQIQRYVDYARERSPHNFHAFYLTLDGHGPSEESLGDVDASEWSDISFASDLKKWLERCCFQTWDVPTLTEIFKQYELLIDRLTGIQRDDVFMNQIERMVSQSKDNFLAAEALSSALIQAKIQMMTRMLNDIDEYMRDHWGDQIEVMKWDHHEEANDFYSALARQSFAGRRGRPWPSITAKLPGIGDNAGLNVAVRIEIDHRLFWGVVFWEGDWRQVHHRSKELIGAFGENSAEWNRRLENRAENSWWIWWSYLPNSGAAENSDNADKLDFVQCDGLYLDLYDEASYQSVLSDIYTVLRENMQPVISTGLPTYLQNCVSLS